MNEDVRVGPIHRMTLDDALERIGVQISNVTIGDGGLNQVLTRRFLPASPRFQPEYLRRDIAVTSIVEQETSHLGVCLDGSEVELLAIMLA